MSPPSQFFSSLMRMMITRTKIMLMMPAEQFFSRPNDDDEDDDEGDDEEDDDDAGAPLGELGDGLSPAGAVPPQAGLRAVRRPAGRSIGGGDSLRGGGVQSL